MKECTLSAFVQQEIISYRTETEVEDHPVSQLAAMRADDNELRKKSLEQIKRLSSGLDEIEIFSYHDPSEFNIELINNNNK